MVHGTPSAATPDESLTVAFGDVDANVSRSEQLSALGTWAQLFRDWRTSPLGGDSTVAFADELVIWDGGEIPGIAVFHALTFRRLARNRWNPSLGRASRRSKTVVGIGYGPHLLRVMVSCPFVVRAGVPGAKRSVARPL